LPQLLDLSGQLGDLIALFERVGSQCLLQSFLAIANQPQLFCNGGDRLLDGQSVAILVRLRASIPDLPRKRLVLGRLE